MTDKKQAILQLEEQLKRQTEELNETRGMLNQLKNGGRSHCKFIMTMSPEEYTDLELAANATNKHKAVIMREGLHLWLDIWGDVID